MERGHFANGADSTAVSALDSVCIALSCNDNSFVCVREEFMQVPGGIYCKGCMCVCIETGCECVCVCVCVCVCACLYVCHNV